MDTIDNITDNEAKILELRLKAQRDRPQSRQLKPRGSCYNCREPFGANDPRLYCDEDCRDDAEKYGIAS